MHPHARPTNREKRSRRWRETEERDASCPRCRVMSSPAVARRYRWNDEIRMTNDEGITKAEFRGKPAADYHSSLIRHSTFVLRHLPLEIPRLRLECHSS